MMDLEDQLTADDSVAMMAAPPQQMVRPAYTVHKLQGEVEHQIVYRDKKSGKLVRKTITRPAGFLVKFMDGHSLRAATIADLKQMGVKSVVPLINTDTMEVVGSRPL